MAWHLSPSDTPPARLGVPYFPSRYRMRSAPPIVLSFAASDPTGGAGLQADVLAIAGMGGYAASVVTAVTVQDTRGVERVLALDAAWVDAQARRVLDDLPVAAFKLGVLASAEIVVCVARILDEHPETPVVFDPVLASGRGDTLATDAVLAAMREWLLPRCAVATPNSLEARRLAHQAGREAASPDECARRLIAAGCRHVLVTGAHEPGDEVVNTLYGANGVLRVDRWPRLPGEYHGSGCTLASALATALAQNMNIADAALRAQDYTHRTLAHAFHPGAGQSLPDRLYALRSGSAPGARTGRA